MIARRFADGYIADERLLTTLELHDEPYWIWRNAGATEGALQPLLARLPDIELFARFVELDAANEGKDLTFLWWFRHELAIAGLLSAQAEGDTDRVGADVVYVNTRRAAGAAGGDRAGSRRAHRRAGEHDAWEGEVLTSDDGLRVWLVWRWRELIRRDGEVIRDALAKYPIFEGARR
jgi:hypothetical protein